MRKSLFLLASAGVLLLSPVVRLSGDDTMVKDLKVNTAQPVVVKSDESVTSAVKDVFAKDMNLSKFSSSVKVDSMGGVVTLSGVVDTEAQKTEFGAKAQSVPGVKTVVNNITVKAVK